MPARTPLVELGDERLDDLLVDARGHGARMQCASPRTSRHGRAREVLREDVVQAGVAHRGRRARGRAASRSAARPAPEVDGRERELRERPAAEVLEVEARRRLEAGREHGAPIGGFGAASSGRSTTLSGCSVTRRVCVVMRGSFRSWLPQTVAAAASLLPRYSARAMPEGTGDQLGVATGRRRACSRCAGSRSAVVAVLVAAALVAVVLAFERGVAAAIAGAAVVLALGRARRVVRHAGACARGATRSGRTTCSCAAACSSLRLSVVPYGRMQFIDVTAGPFERSFGLATVRMHTAAAASDARIPGLAADEAARVARPARRARRGAGGRAVTDDATAGTASIRCRRSCAPAAPRSRSSSCSCRRRSAAAAPRGLGRAAARRSSACCSLLGFVSWLVTRWRIDGDDLRIETGLLRRQSLRFPLAQVQAIDIVRPGLARMFRVAELRLRMGGATGGTARLAYLPEREAEPLRARLLALAHRGRARDAARAGRRRRGAGAHLGADRPARRLDPRSATSASSSSASSPG